MSTAVVLEPHPLVLYARSRGWTYGRAADHFEVPGSTFKQLVRGWTGVSVGRADRWEALSGGEVRAIDVLRWYQRNRRDKENGT